MFSMPSRRTRRPRATQIQTIPAQVEGLERRELLSFSSLGMSLPDLVVTGQAGATAAYGAMLTVQVDVQNIGASSIIEPLNLTQGAPSSADAPPSFVGVYITRSPVLNRGAIKLGDIAVPGVLQNSAVELTQSFPMPATRPRGFPGSGSKIYVQFVANDGGLVLEIDPTNNVSPPVAVTVNAPLPELQVINLDVPPVMQPGDTIAPVIKIANDGTVDTDLQAPVTVFLVASTDTSFGPTDVIVGRYQVQNIAPLAQAPMRQAVLGDNVLDDPPNVVTVSVTTSGSSTVTLPAGRIYNLGVIVDPFHEIRQIKDIAHHRTAALSFVNQVGPHILHLPPAGILGSPALLTNVFPFPAYAVAPSSFPVSAFVTTTSVQGSELTPNVVRIPSRRPTAVSPPGSGIRTR